MPLRSGRRCPAVEMGAGVEGNPTGAHTPDARQYQLLRTSFDLETWRSEAAVK